MLCQLSRNCCIISNKKCLFELGAVFIFSLLNLLIKIDMQLKIVISAILRIYINTFLPPVTTVLFPHTFSQRANFLLIELSSLIIIFAFGRMEVLILHFWEPLSKTKAKRFACSEASPSQKVQTGLKTKKKPLDEQTSGWLAFE